MKYLRLVGIVVATGAFLFLTACGSDSKKKEEVNITISPAPADTHVGLSKSFTVTVTGSTNTGFDISTNPASGAGCIITNNNVVCLPTAEGRYDLTVTAKADPTKTKTVTLDVTEVSIAISQDMATVEIGNTVTFTVTTQHTDFAILSVNPETGAGCDKTSDTEVKCTPTVANDEYTLTVVTTEEPKQTKEAKFIAVEPGPEEIDGMVYMTAGTFIMGCTSEIDDKLLNNCTDSWKPPHDVTLSHDFYIGKYEVTQAVWKTVMDGDNPSEHQGDDLPVTHVSWNEIQTFISKLNEQNIVSGWKWSLPTEAQWEYAAKAGTNYAYSGSDDYEEVAWMYSNSGRETHPVGQKLPNDWGIYDMSGNVAEFVTDWFGAYPSDHQTDPVGVDEPARRAMKVYRGGPFDQLAVGVAVVYRGAVIPTVGVNNVGFRLALVPDPDYIPDAVATSTATPTFFESVSGTVSGLWDSAISGIKSLWNSITK
jgi:formylglycine-generating enzyme required for sulfatase activity